MKAVTRKAVEAAAFWDRAICLDCDEVHEADEIDGETCPTCGKDAVMSAATLVRVGEYLDGLEK